jgi:predicted phosphodiesterase
VRIAVVADIHGNVRALEAVLKDLKHRSPDAVVNLGDCVSGPLWPEDTAALLRDLDWPTVRGNHDRVVAAGAVPSDNRTDSFTEAALSPRSAAWLGTLQPAIRFSDEVFLCHGTPRNDNTYLTEDVVDGGARVSAEHRIAGRLEGEASPIICCGHSHLPRLVRLHVSGQLVLNPGSVGLQAYQDETPRPHMMATYSPHARYAVLDKQQDAWSVNQRAIEYDWDSAGKAAALNGRPDWAHALLKGCMQTKP